MNIQSKHHLNQFADGSFKEGAVLVIDAGTATLHRHPLFLLNVNLRADAVLGRIADMVIIRCVKTSMNAETKLAHLLILFYPRHKQISRQISTHSQTFPIFRGGSKRCEK